MTKKYLKNRFYTEIKNCQRNVQNIENVKILEDDPKFVIEAKNIFNSVISEDYFEIIVDYDKNTWYFTLS